MELRSARMVLSEPGHIGTIVPLMEPGMFTHGTKSKPKESFDPQKQLLLDSNPFHPSPQYMLFNGPMTDPFVPSQPQSTGVRKAHFFLKTCSSSMQNLINPGPGI